MEEQELKRLLVAWLAAAGFALGRRRSSTRTWRDGAGKSPRPETDRSRVWSWSDRSHRTHARRRFSLARSCMKKSRRNHIYCPYVFVDGFVCDHYRWDRDQMIRHAYAGTVVMIARKNHQMILGNAWAWLYSCVCFYVCICFGIRRTIFIRQFQQLAIVRPTYV
jgi:hypothetical protein